MNTLKVQTSTLTVDVLVVGSGTGMAAALAAHEQGLSVLIVEKTDYVGGSTARSGGAFWIPDNIALQRDGAIRPRAQTEMYLDAVVGDSAPRNRYLSFLDHGPAAIAMLERMTALRFFWNKGYADYFPDLPGGDEEGSTCEAKPFDLNRLGKEQDRFRKGDIEAPLPMPVTGFDYKWMNLMMKTPLKSWPIIFKRLVQGAGGLLFGKRYVAGGQAIAAGMFDGLIRAGVPIWTKSEVIELIQTEARVTGAIVQQHNQRINITARRGVILAAGGFDHNMSMRSYYQSPSLIEDFSLGSPGNVGDGLKLGQSVGAGLRSMHEAWWFPAVKPITGYPPILLAERFLPGSLIVNEQGQRFVNEALGYMAFGQTMLQLEHEGNPVGQMWLVFDQEYRNSYVLAGSIFPRQKIPQTWYDAGIAVKAETPEQLAMSAGWSPSLFKDQLERYNEMARVGTDTQFKRGANAYDRYYGDPTVKPNPNLRPLSGTLYAIKLVLSDLGTCGGLAADEKAHVLREDGSVISGLYVIGNNAGNAFGRAYPGAGGTIGQGVTFAYIAVQDIIAQGRT
ncbi:3-ketosteroid-delta-1-dehydrogenase [Acinetobacter proteolyticus]|uniref:3-ketosteroid-delta-1-dehydrogenase n=1 Tax=Acinetobacter proteolyticus TaxID=1776741 RepID=UPI00086344D0|nr:3-ketosteroid-delta-1-dehydrogenase [Acinetobacter proteolyticus]OEY96467.1 3-ketosteroid-delta-1-dehydrogenase [Acinetobacter proteolyticus]